MVLTLFVLRVLKQGKQGLRSKRVFVALAAFLVLFFLFVITSSAPVRLIYIYATNIDVQTVGVFRVENSLDEPVTFWSGAFQPIELDRTKRNPVADLGGPRRFAAGLTNTLEIVIPTNGASYRLVLNYRPDSQMRHRSPLIEKTLHLLPSGIRYRMYAPSIVTSDYFQVPRPSDGK